jgi:hypothetical protein
MTTIRAVAGLIRGALRPDRVSLNRRAERRVKGGYGEEPSLDGE